MAETPAAKRASRARDAAAKDDAEERDVTAADDDAAEERAGASEGGAATPPPPPTETADPGTGAADAYAKDTLIKRADKLLGVTPALARGLLREAEDPITIDAAKARIQGFLEAPVANTEEA